MLGTLLVGLGPPTTDPAELLERAGRLQASGLDLLIETRRLSPGLVHSIARDLTDLHGPPFVPAVHAGLWGLRVGDHATALKPLGLARDDLLVTLNGTPLGDPDSRAFGPLPFGEPHLLVLEIVRAGRHHLLAYRW